MADLPIAYSTFRRDLPYRGRIAPSPTGRLHLGHAATFLRAAQRALQANGTLVLRNDDLDRERCREAYWRSCVEDLAWLGIAWTEGPEEGGAYAPYKQSLRSGWYVEAFEVLRAGGWIYPCRCSRKEVALALSAPHAGSPAETYPGTCRPSDSTPSFASRAGQNWRFRIPFPQKLRFEDGFFGPQCCEAGVEFGDFLIWRKDDTPSYQLATVVDDAAMRVSEVVRGADLIESTFQQLLLYGALRLPSPAFFHSPLVCDAEGRRLAKRTDALALQTLRQRGVPPSEIRAWALGVEGADTLPSAWNVRVYFQRSSRSPRGAD